MQEVQDVLFVLRVGVGGCVGAGVIDMGGFCVGGVLVLGNVGKACVDGCIGGCAFVCMRVLCAFFFAR